MTGLDLTVGILIWATLEGTFQGCMAPLYEMFCDANNDFKVCGHLGAVGHDIRLNL